MTLREALMRAREEGLSIHNVKWHKGAHLYFDDDKCVYRHDDRSAGVQLEYIYQFSIEDIVSTDWMLGEQKQL